MSRLRSRLRFPLRGGPLSALLMPYGRIPGLRTAKTTLAAILSYVAAEQLGTSPQPVLASLTALLVVQLTMYETVAHSVQRVASVLAGVLVAVGVATFVGLTWWSLGTVVFLSLVIGQVLRLGPQLLEVPISAMLVLAVGGAENVAAPRVYETLIGAAVGIAVNGLIVPPLYVRPAGEAIGELAERLAHYLRGFAGQLREGWSRAAADRWLNEARALGADVARADEQLARAEQSARLNPRGALARQAQPRLRTALTGLEHCYISLRNLARALFDLTYFVPDDEAATVFRPETLAALADVLDCAAEALDDVGAVAEGIRSADAARADVEEHLAELRRRRDRLAQVLLVDPHADQAAWEQHGALLAAVDRLRVEVEAAVRPSETAWRPPLVTERQRQAVRRVFDVAAQAAVELRPSWTQARTDESRRRRTSSS
jgi:uncharacterized membrane protein YgaE (UPF0421/DUF939 family)